MVLTFNIFMTLYIMLHVIVLSLVLIMEYLFLVHSLSGCSTRNSVISLNQVGLATKFQSISAQLS